MVCVCVSDEVGVVGHSECVRQSCAVWSGLCERERERRGKKGCVCMLVCQMRNAWSGMKDVCVDLVPYGPMCVCEWVCKTDRTSIVTGNTECTLIPISLCTHTNILWY